MSLGARAPGPETQVCPVFCRVWCTVGVQGWAEVWNGSRSPSSHPARPLCEQNTLAGLGSFLPCGWLTRVPYSSASLTVTGAAHGCPVPRWPQGGRARTRETSQHPGRVLSPHLSRVSRPLPHLWPCSCWVSRVPRRGGSWESQRPRLQPLWATAEPCDPGKSPDLAEPQFPHP